MAKPGKNIPHAVQMALRTMPQTSYEPRAVRDYDGQRLTVEQIIEQLKGEAGGAESRVLTMILYWTCTGNWPAFRNAPIYFLREALQCAAGTACYQNEADFPDTPPPWSPKHAAEFLRITAVWWFWREQDKWAGPLAHEDYELNERIRNLHSED